MSVLTAPQSKGYSMTTTAFDYLLCFQLPRWACDVAVHAGWWSEVRGVRGRAEHRKSGPKGRFDFSKIERYSAPVKSMRRVPGQNERHGTR